MKFVVTGGAGFIGSHLSEYLIKEGHSVIVIDDLSVGKIENLENIKEKIDFHQVDILDFEEMEKIVNSVDGIFHEAALASVPESFEKPELYNKVNVGGTENIFKLAKKNGFKVVHASSSSIYGNPTKVPINENDEKKSFNPYASTKIEDEMLVQKYSELGVSIIGLRYFNVYGKRQSGQYAGVITKFMERLSQKKQPIIDGDGMQLRDFVFVEDVVRANLAAMTSDLIFGFFNVGTGKAISILELAKLLIDLYGLSIEPIFGPTRKGDVKKSVADMSLAIKKLNWKPETKLEDGLLKIIK